MTIQIWDIADAPRRWRERSAIEFGPLYSFTKRVWRKALTLIEAANATNYSYYLHVVRHRGS